MTTNFVIPGCAYLFDFTNHRGEMATRIVIARSVHWGSTPWHDATQFFLEAFDLEKQEIRLFPFANMNPRSFRRFTDEEIDAFLSKTIRAAYEEGVDAGKQEPRDAEVS